MSVFCFQLFVVVFHLVSFVGGTARRPVPRPPARARLDLDSVQTVGVATTCSEQGDYCECKFGKVRYGLEPDWSEWVYVGSAPRVLCDHDNAQFPQFLSVAWFATQYCQCERTEVKENLGRIPEGTVLYLFKVGMMENQDPRLRLSPRVQAIIKEKAAQLRGKTAADSEHYWGTEFPKQVAVGTASVVAGVGVTILAGPVVLAAIGTHSAIVATSAIIGAAGANYVVTAGTEGAMRYALDTDDRDREIFSAQEAIVGIGARAATLGVFQGAGLEHVITHGVNSAMHAGHAANHHGMMAMGDKVVAWSSESICETGFEEIHKAGISATTNAAGELVSTANMDKLPEIMFKETSLGIILNLLLSGVGIQSARYGNGGYAGLAENLESLRRSAQEVIQQYGPGPIQHESFLTLAIAERTVGRIFHPNHDNAEHFRRAPGTRFPVCKHMAPSTEPVCYCLRHQYVARADRAPTLGVDVDFCVFNQACVPGEGVQNARCMWASEIQVPGAQQMVGRLYLAYTNGVPNCFAQHLNGWRCTDCKQVGQECATEEFMGQCQQITDALSCIRNGEQVGQQINPDGSRKTPGQIKSGLVQRSLNKTPPPRAPAGKIILQAREVLVPAPGAGLGGFVAPRPGPPGGRTPLDSNPPLPKFEIKPGVHQVQSRPADLPRLEPVRGAAADGIPPLVPIRNGVPIVPASSLQGRLQAGARPAAPIVPASSLRTPDTLGRLPPNRIREATASDVNGRAPAGRITDGFPIPPWQQKRGADQRISAPLRAPRDVSKAIFYCTAVFGLFFYLLACARHKFRAKPNVDQEAPLLPTLH